MSFFFYCLLKSVCVFVVVFWSTLYIQSVLICLLSEYFNSTFVSESDDRFLYWRLCIHVCTQYAYSLLLVCFPLFTFHHHCLIGLVFKASTSRAAYPSSITAVPMGMFSGTSLTSDLKIGTAVATLPGAWQYRVSTGTGWPSVSVLWLGEIESLICNFCLIVAELQLSEQIRPWDTLACCWNVKQASNQQTLHHTAVGFCRL